MTMRTQCQGSQRHSTAMQTSCQCSQWPHWHHLSVKITSQTHIFLENFANIFTKPFLPVHLGPRWFFGKKVLKISWFCPFNPVKDNKMFLYFLHTVHMYSVRSYGWIRNQLLYLIRFCREPDLQLRFLGVAMSVFCVCSLLEITRYYKTI